MFFEENGRLVRCYDAEILWVEPWGENSLRVRATCGPEMPEKDWALITPPACSAAVELCDTGASITNGKLRAFVSNSGKITFYNQNGKLLLEEFIRDMDQPFTSHMRIRSREHKGIPGGLYAITQWFESDPEEKLFGMGQYQQGTFNLKGSQLELAHRNAQASVPFVLSDKGYGMLWHNPAIGEATFGTNITKWHAVSSELLDYWITAGDTPSEIVESYVHATGLPPMMPDYAMGFWQCKLRYRTQEELLEVAREYKRRGLPISVIVIDYFHWTKHGDWKFDPRFWPDPEGMVKELKEMGIEVAVSIWPTVQQDSENYKEMLEKGYLTRTDMGARVSIHSMEWTIYFDATNENARKYVWEKAKKSYYDCGIKTFWLDVAEPQYNFGFELYRYQMGSHLTIGNLYPQLYTKGFYDGLKENGEEGVLALARCAWAGSQRYGALVWSGDIHSSFKSMRWQLCAGLHMAVAGIPWWTTDIGGFDGGNIHDKGFQELLVRWFQWGAFSPVMRLHGDRQPHDNDLAETGVTDYTGAPDEVWSFGDENTPILEKYLKLREAMLPYIRRTMRECHEKGTPVMRPLFYHYSSDPRAWETSECYLFGRDLLVAPVLEAGATSVEVYLPAGENWTEWSTGKTYAGGQTVTSPAPIDTIPVFIRGGATVEGLNS